MIRYFETGKRKQKIYFGRLIVVDTETDTRRIVYTS